MWHTAEIVKIFEKMTEGYGYDIYQNRKLCVALCNDLFADYSVEKNIMQMLFQAGLGEAMKGVPFKSERELKMGLSNIEKFLMAQAIESSVRDDVLDVMRLAFVDKGVNYEVKSAYQPVISKNFNDSHLDGMNRLEKGKKARFKDFPQPEQEHTDSFKLVIKESHESDDSRYDCNDPADDRDTHDSDGNQPATHDCRQCHFSHRRNPNPGNLCYSK